MLIQQCLRCPLISGRVTSLAEFERETIKERTKAGLVAAKARGRAGGRPCGLSAAAAEKARSAKILYESGTKSVEEIAKILSISRATCYRYLESAANY
jgi:DNA invertase Pin-like site-specific DNA recombinase